MHQKGMFALIDRKRFWDPICIVWIIIFLESPILLSLYNWEHHRIPCLWTCVQKVNLASRTASKRLSVPTALISKSSNGMEAALSCDGWAAV